MDAFSTTNTQEADDAEIVAFGQAKSATRRASEVNTSYHAETRKFRIGSSFALVWCGALSIAIVVAMVEADRFYKREAMLNQEVLAKW
ncbi:hypothetical protein D3C80_1033700 [compost metagenome]